MKLGERRARVATAMLLVVGAVLGGAGFGAAGAAGFGASAFAAAHRGAAKPHDETHPITLSGAAQTVTLSTPGSVGTYTFSGTTGQRVAAQISSSTLPGCTAYLYSLVRPDASTLGTTQPGCGASTFFDAQTLDQTGTWAIRIAAQGTATGTAQLNGYDSSNQIRPITLNDGTDSVNITQPGENGQYTFTGSVGEGVSAQVTGATFTGTCPNYTMYLMRPDGSQFGTVANGCTDPLMLDTQTLDQNGTWSFVVDPQGSTKGKAKIRSFEDADQTLPITLNGAQDQVVLGPGAHGFYTFTGTIGQQVSATVSNSTFPGCIAYDMYLQRPDDSQLGSALSACGASAFFDSMTLDQNGTWAFAIVPEGGAGGAAALQAYTFADQTGTADLTGKATKLVLAKPGQNAALTFAGTTGMHISAYVSQSTLAGCTAFALSLVRPDGSELAGPVSSCTDNAWIDTQTLDQNGTWTVFIDPQGTSTGLAQLQVYSVTDVTPAIKPGGPIKSFTTILRGVNAHYRFSGKSGDSRTVTITGNTFEGPTCPGLAVSFIRPNGTALAPPQVTCSPNLTVTGVLDVTGNWTILVDPQGPAKGTLIIKVT